MTGETTGMSRGVAYLVGRQGLSGGQGGEDDAATSAGGDALPMLVDDYLIAASEGLATTLHAMTKLPEPVLQAAAPWERPETGGLWGIPNAIYDPGRRPLQALVQQPGHLSGPQPAAGAAYSCYVTSSDGMHWERPNLGLFAHEGSTANNIVGMNGTASPKWRGCWTAWRWWGWSRRSGGSRTCGWVGRDDSGQGGHGVSFSAGRHPLGAV